MANSVNPLDAIARHQPVIAAIPNVATDPAPGDRDPGLRPGPKLCVRLHPHDHYWRVFDTLIPSSEPGAAGCPVPETLLLAYRQSPTSGLRRLS